jgi:hypothetical protein
MVEGEGWESAPTSKITDRVCALFQAWKRPSGRLPHGVAAAIDANRRATAAVA